MTISQIIFWICLIALAHSYVLYPILLRLNIVIKGSYEPEFYQSHRHLPFVSILMAAYNEEKVIERKIESIFNTTYPAHKIEVLIASDNSTDKTNHILKKIAAVHPEVKVFYNSTRKGKINNINYLQTLAKGEILIITDANVMLEEQTLFETIKYFKDTDVGLVDTHMTNYGISKTGISFQEKAYISREVFVKHLESRAFGKMIGPFGGCYALRKELFSPVPHNYLVDDFFICMNVLAQKRKTINNLKAVVHEDVSNILKVEFKRKVRIATGNFQNLFHFRKLLLPPFSQLSFSFFSHKVLRWFGPFFIAGALISNILLFHHSMLYQLLLYIHLFITFLPIADFFLKKIGIHVVLLRFATHFYAMNLSLLAGLFKSIKGVKSNVWKPTQRLQE